MTSQLQLEPGGHIQGWVSSISPDGPLPNEENVVKATGLLPELPDGMTLPSTATKNQLNLMRYLQNMAGQAKSDQAALIKEFNERLEARAGKAFEKVDILDQKLDETRQELKRVQKELDKTKTTLANREETIKQQLEELAEAEVKTNQQRQKIDDYKQSFESLLQEHEALQEAKNAADMTILETLREVDALNEQIRTLETTLQNSIRRTTEQEDALLHWQELADNNQESITRLEKEKETLNQQLEENALITGKLREKNGRLEFELRQALNEMDDLRNRMLDATVEEMQFALADARQHIATLNGQLEETQQSAAEVQEQKMWLNVNLKTTQRALEESRAIIAQQSALLEELQADKVGGEQTAGKWRTAVEEMAARLQEKEKEFQIIKTQHAGQIEAFETAIAELKDDIHHKTLQVEALEAEIETNLGRTDEQGQLLADIQAHLIERELEIDQIKQQLKQAHNKITWQANFINKMKRITSETITDLEARLEKAQRPNKPG